MKFFKSIRTLAGAIWSELWGGLFVNAAVVGPAQVAITYAAAMTPELATGSDQIITATNGVAFTVNAPTFAGAAMSATNPPIANFVWRLTIRNTSGGAAGALTLNAVFKIGAAWTQPATGNSRTIWFRWNGTNHVEIGRTAADVAN